MYCIIQKLEVIQVFKIKATIKKAKINLFEFYRKGKTFSVVRILLISNLKAPVDSDGLEDIVGMFQQNDIELVIM